MKRKCMEENGDGEYLQQNRNRGNGSFNTAMLFRACERCSAECRVKSRRGVNGSHVPSFCIFLRPDCRSKLRIPREFVAQLKDQLREDLILEGPSGQIWIVTRDSEMSLVKGWDTFVSNHSVEDGELLVFNMVHPSFFKVHIYGRDGGERHANFRIDVDQMDI